MGKMEKDRIEAFEVWILREMEKIRDRVDRVKKKY